MLHSRSVDDELSLGVSVRAPQASGLSGSSPRGNEYSAALVEGPNGFKINEGIYFIQRCGAASFLASGL